MVTERKSVSFYYTTGWEFEVDNRSSIEEGLGGHTQEREGALYTYDWINLPFEHEDMITSPINQEPLHLIPLTA